MNKIKSSTLYQKIVHPINYYRYERLLQDLRMDIFPSKYVDKLTRYLITLSPTDGYFHLLIIWNRPYSIKLTIHMHKELLRHIKAFSYFN